jgi:hypothetical protein
MQQPPGGGNQWCSQYNKQSGLIKLCKIKVSIQIFTYLATVAHVENDEEGGMKEGGMKEGGMNNDVDQGSRTELDSHANMPVGRHAYIILDTGEWQM